MNHSTPRFAVIGHPVAHSRSPQIHAAFAKQVGMALIYERIDAEPGTFASTVDQFFSSGGHGLNVTVPFKEEAWQLAQAHLSDRARLAGAVNTLWQTPTGIHGCNTDGIGLVRDLQRLNLLKPGARVLLLGAGGAAKGVIGPLLAADCKRLHVANRTAARAQALRQAWLKHQPAHAERLSAGAIDAQLSEQHWDLVVNATASSLQGQSLGLPTGLYQAHTGAYDMMYGALPTAFLEQAATHGVTQLADGLGMLVEQAAESFFIWHGKRPDVTPVIDDLRSQMTSAVR
jgi:shikimate dehydrogenase